MLDCWLAGDQGKPLNVQLLGTTMGAPSRVVGLWIPDQDVTFGRLDVGTNTAGLLHNYILGQPSAEVVNYQMKAGGTEIVLTPMSVVASQIAGQAVLAPTNASDGINLFPTVNMEIVDGTELLGFCGVIKLPSDQSSVTGVLSVMINGNLQFRIQAIITSASAAAVSALLASNNAAASVTPVTIADAANYTLPGNTGLLLNNADTTAGHTKIYLLTAVFDGAVATLRSAKGARVVAPENFSAWTGNFDVLASRSTRAAIMTSANNVVQLGPFCLFKATTQPDNLLEIENFIHQLAGSPDLFY